MPVTKARRIEIVRSSLRPVMPGSRLGAETSARGTSTVGQLASDDAAKAEIDGVKLCAPAAYHHESGISNSIFSAGW